MRVVDLGFAQPKAVHLSTRLTGFRKQAVNFIVASHGELADTNFKRFGEQPSLPEVLKRLLTADVSRHGVIPEVRSLKAADYVGLLAKPSILNKIQTEVYKIQPYTLRKETQTLILRFFNGLVTLTEVLKILDKSMKTEKIKPLIKEGVSLRDAVLMLKRKSAEEVEAETGMLSFDLLYLSRARR